MAYECQALKSGSFRPMCRAVQLWYQSRILSQSSTDRNVVLFCFPDGQTLVRWIRSGDTTAHELLCFNLDTAESDILPMQSKAIREMAEKLRTHSEGPDGSTMLMVGIIVGVLRCPYLYAAYLVPRVIPVTEIQVLHWEYGKYLGMNVAQEQQQSSPPPEERLVVPPLCIPVESST